MKAVTIENRSFDEERALYALKNASIKNCVFGGDRDGESPLKETDNIEISDCTFALRYPLWHTRCFTLDNSKITESSRAALWYAKHASITKCSIDGIKCLRECEDIRLDGCKIDSAEFGWKCNNIRIKNSDIKSEYFLFDSKEAEIDGIRLSGKYSFQYTKNFRISNSRLKTKDAFWHSENSTVTDCVLEGEYLGWYSKNLTLINCTVTGTQPLCYCKGLKLIGCKMNNTDLAFEYSEVEADISGNIESVKNPLSGRIRADSIGGIITDGGIKSCKCEITVENR